MTRQTLSGTGPRTAIALALSALGTTASALAAGPIINEFSTSTAGVDVEYVEILGAPLTDYSRYAILEIEGDGSAAGTVDEFLPLGSTDGSGRLLLSVPANTFENGSLTLLLVQDFTGAAGQDLDSDNDGSLDAAPWSELADAIAVLDGGSADRTYGPALGPNFDGVSPFAPGGASRVPDGASTWVRNDFDLAGIAGFPGSLVAGEALNTPGTANTSTDTPVIADQCGDPATLIHQIQGSGRVFDPAFGGVQRIEAVVTAIKPGLGGLYVQEEAVDQDADPATSEGLFVFLGGTEASGVSVGDRVRVSGTVAEFVTSGGASSQTQMSGSPAVTRCGTGEPVAAVPITLPLTDDTALESVEGMLVSLPQTLQISEYFNFDRFGEVVLSLPTPGFVRPMTPTAVVAPGEAATALASANRLATILVDDGNSAQNPDPAIHPGNGQAFTLDNRFRGGDTITDVTGVVDDLFGRYRLQPTVYGGFEPVNPRPDLPPAVGGNLRVASLNVLNFFLTLDNQGSVCGPLRDQGCRGADTADEFSRQQAKLLDALLALDGDIVGLVEMENTVGVEPAGHLASELNAVLGSGTYAYIDTGPIGSDAIRVGLLYKPSRVSPEGPFTVLDGGVDSRFVDDRNRPALAQTFRVVEGGTRLTIAVNHLKSKGSACDDIGDPDVGDGQGNCNLTRTAAAEALADWLATQPTGVADDGALIIGDLNAYDKEDPIVALKAAGFEDLLARFGGEGAYSYVFDGQAGYLDHALAGSSIARAVTGAASWHVNADEPDLLDYDTSFKKAAQQALFEPTVFRSSDHDPVLVGLDLLAPTLNVSASPSLLWPPNHRMVPVRITATAEDDQPGTAPTVKLLSVTSSALDSADSDIRVVDDRTVLLRAERENGQEARVYTLTYEAEDAAGNRTLARTFVSVPANRGR